MHEAATMSTYRQIRRQTRRAGLQPIVVIDSPFPVPAAVILARLAWRYRSEIAPATMAGAVLVAGWWLHHGHASQWPWLLTASDLAAAALTALGARIGLARLAERVYAATAVLTAGGWLAAAALLGPLSTPMPQVLVIGTVLLAVPWWAHRRRRARARVAAGAFSLAGHLQGDRPSRFQDPVRQRGPVGMARPRQAGPRADHRRRDRADTRDRIGTGHLPRRGSCLPDRRRQGQPMRAASAGH
jgi:hypothetical protein